MILPGRLDMVRVDLFVWGFVEGGYRLVDGVLNWVWERLLLLSGGCVAGSVRWSSWELRGWVFVDIWVLCLKARTHWKRWRLGCLA